MSSLSITRHAARTADGWQLDLKRTVSPAHFVPSLRPLLIVPGYGMNSFIFGFHPRGTSMERCLAEAGFEVWSGDLRAQGGSRKLDTGAPGPSLRAYAETDLAALVDAVLAGTASTHARVDLIGCSLGGSIAYAHLALAPSTRVHSLVTIGAPLRWREVHPLLKVVFGSPHVAGMLRVSGSRKIAGAAMGMLTRFPALLGFYMNAAHVDLSAAGQMVATVEDPHPRVNRDIAHWMRARDMVLAGVNVTEALSRQARPLYVVVSNRDGIVPESAARSALDAWGGGDTAFLRVGDEREWYAHADLFIAHDSPTAVFAPIATWLKNRA